MSDHSRVIDLLIRWEELRDAGRAMSPEELCRDCPELLGEVREGLQALGGAAALLPMKTEIPSESDPAPHADMATNARQFIGKVPGYELTELIGHGGMGVVFRARDLSLNREVAVKILQDRFAVDSIIADRFVAEAQITGQLQHPGIPAVYQVGRLADGRPFLAMKLIKGNTLDDMIGQKANAPTKQNSEQSSTNLVAIFESICHAVGFAHSYQVIHRDLKPSNVMVGRFGEVQVMDWGLAKVLSQAAEPETSTRQSTDKTAATEIRPIDSETPVTQFGSVLGTPAFMPPEQAAGEINKIDVRSDVFGLGAILCKMLTGQPPFTGDNSELVRINAIRGKTEEAFARLDACGAEPDLIALCKRCLAFDSTERPANGQAVAQAVAELRLAAEDRARQAELARARAEVHAQEQSKRRRVLQWTTGVVALVLLLGISGTTAGMIRAEWAKDAEAKRAETEAAAKLQAAAAEQLAKDRQAQAERSRDEARRRYKLALDAFSQMVFSIQDKLEDRPGTQDLRKDLLENARAGLQALLREAEKQGETDSALVWSYFRMGEVELVLGNTVGAQTEYQAGHARAKRLAEADPTSVRSQHDLAVSFNRLGDVTMRLGQLNEARDHFQNALAIAQRLVDADATNVEAQSDVSVCLLNLGDVAFRVGPLSEAIDYYERSAKIAQRLADADPNNAPARKNLIGCLYKLGDVKLKQGQTDAVREYYFKALQISQQVVDADPKNIQSQRDLATSFERMGNLMLHLNLMKEALEYHSNGLKIREALVEADPKNAVAQRDICTVFTRMGDVAMRVGEPQQALELYSKCLRIRQRLADLEPLNAEAQRDIGICYERLGNLALSRGEFETALDHLQKGLEVCRRLANANPSDARAQRDLGVTLFKMGSPLRLLGRIADAFRVYNEALTIRQRLADADPNNAQAIIDLAACRTMLGMTWKADFEFAKAAESLRVAIQLIEPLRKAGRVSGSQQQWTSIVDRELLECQNAERSLSDIEFVFAQKPAQISSMLLTRVKALLKHKKPADARTTAERFAKWAESQESNRDAKLYDAACAHALCAAAADPKDRPKIVEQALAALTKCRDAGYFQSADRLVRLQKDPELSALRGEPIFQQFAKSLDAKSHRNQ